MELETRRSGVVLSFPPRPVANAPIQARVDAAREAALNTQWDRMLQLARQAWTWRDPESLAALDAAVTALGREVRCEWGT